VPVKQEEAASCQLPGCPEAAAKIGESMGAIRVVAAHLVKTGEEVELTIYVHDVETGEVGDFSVTTTSSGLLAQLVKLLKKALPKYQPPVVVAPEPEPVVVEPEPKIPGFSDVPQKEAIDAAKEFCAMSDPPDRNAQNYYCMWANNYRASIALIITGAAATAVGVTFTIVSGVLWKKFDEWKDGVERDCFDCIPKAVKKLKVNSAMTGLAIGHFVPGAIVVFAGLIKWRRLLDRRKDMEGFVPDVSFAPPGLGGPGELTLTWRF
jgi:hypothetical protein